MKQIVISDRTLCRERKFTFKEKLEIARLLEKIRVDVIELPPIRDERADPLCVRTLSAFVSDAVVSVEAGCDAGSVKRAAEALSAAKKKRIRVALPLSPVGMEYTAHKKPQKMLDYIREVVTEAKALAGDVEFEAIDATRAEEAFLSDAVKAAVEAGAGSVTLSDTAASMMPDDFAAFVSRIADGAGVPVYVSVSDLNGLAVACALLAVRGAAAGVKVAVGGDVTALSTFSDLIRNRGGDLGLSTRLAVTELHRTVRQIEWIGGERKDAAPSGEKKAADEGMIALEESADPEAIAAAVARLGYDLSDEDLALVSDEVRRVAGKKTVGERELEAIVASAALQVPATYQLDSYVINSGNIISASAQITLTANGKSLHGVSIGDGPIDAAFRALESVIGHRYELDDFKIQAITEGQEAVGSALIRLRSGGKLYSGNGVSTDILGAAIRAYLNAVNKIVYEENAQ